MKSDTVTLSFNGSGSDLATDVLGALARAPSTFNELDRFMRAMLDDPAANLAARLHFHARCGLNLHPSAPSADE